MAGWRGCRGFELRGGQKDDPDHGYHVGSEKIVNFRVGKLCTLECIAEGTGSRTERTLITMSADIIRPGHNDSHESEYDKYAVTETPHNTSKSCAVIL